MIGLDKQNRLFERIGKSIEKTDAFVLGGSAMLYYNFSKVATKDIDIVTKNEKDRKAIASELEKLGFKRIATPKNPKEPLVLELGDFLLDIFSENVFSFKLSEGTSKRAREKVTYGNLTVYVISPEDIILSKSMTDRTNDREDVMDIVKEASIDWEIVLEECRWQADNSDPRFVIYLYDFLDDLVHDFGLEIPMEIEKEIKKIYRKYLDSIDPKG